MTSRSSTPPEKPSKAGTTRRRRSGGKTAPLSFELEVPVAGYDAAFPPVLSDFTFSSPADFVPAYPSPAASSSSPFVPGTSDTITQEQSGAVERSVSGSGAWDVFFGADS